ncbi:MAG TPA: hypothetical protein VK698_15460 [Kofleriaceae bacterium]|nr:hypothetical protein [Kofleriaceae bacterium]
MTARRDRKKLVRERQARTGERYTTALKQVLDGKKDAVPVLELEDLTATAAALGFRCKVIAFPDLLARLDPEVILGRIRSALLATEDDPTTRTLRGVALRGEHPEPAPPTLGGITATRQFVARAQAGLGGVSPGGRMMALYMSGRRGVVTVLCMLWSTPMPLLAPREPALILATPEGLSVSRTDRAPLRFLF